MMLMEKKAALLPLRHLPLLARRLWLKLEPTPWLILLASLALLLLWATQ
jgi:hypothetical protein